jgi:steroid delta-isomerase-like uncharacterized protein
MRRISIVVVLLGLTILALRSGTSAPAGAQSASPVPDPDANAALVRRGNDAVFNAHDVTAVADYVAAAYVDHEPDPAVTTDRAAFIRSLTETFAAFPDIHYAIEDLAAAGDEVWTRTRICGTQTGTFQGVPATNRHICIEAIDIVRIADGLIVEHWGLIDEVGLLRQLGVMPGA